MRPAHVRAAHRVARVQYHYYVFYVLKAKCSAVSERGRVGARKAFSAAMLIASC